ncbi:hypothetical protein DFH06DRAFT_1370017 [Mycena polygramma]|nr:hypothetical protein DFH06DRAFT_1370017 [Mycena polygramma]
MTCDQRTLILCRGASWALLSSLVPAAGLDSSWVHRLAHRGTPLSKSLPKDIALEPSRAFSKNRQHHLYVLLNPLTLSQAADRTPQHVRRATSQRRIVILQSPFWELGGDDQSLSPRDLLAANFWLIGRSFPEVIGGQTEAVLRNTLVLRARV